MTPPTVNASYSSTLNQIQFPAGILQPPFFDPNADDAVNYGALGAVIGHEMTHGFDDSGRQFDAEGNLRDWWTPDDAAKYKAAAQLVVDQFNGYTVVDSVSHVNGRQTLGENIADLGGLTVAYYAMEKAIAGKPHAKIDGFTPEQRFFLAWAQIWRGCRPKRLNQIETDAHSRRASGASMVRIRNMPSSRRRGATRTACDGAAGTCAPGSGGAPTQAGALAASREALSASHSSNSTAYAVTAAHELLPMSVSDLAVC
jgi:putative endopeptidase